MMKRYARFRDKRVTQMKVECLELANFRRKAKKRMDQTCDVIGEDPDLVKAEPLIRRSGNHEEVKNCQLR